MHTLLRAAVAGSVVLAGFAVAPLAADAAPTGCTTSQSGRTGTARCGTDAPGTEFAVRVTCKHATSASSVAYYTFTGPWKTQGKTASSSATCQTDDSLVRVVAVTR